MPFQTQVGVVPAPAIEGDFASANPRFSMLAGPGALVAGPSGVTVGRFAWVSSQYMDPDNAPAIANNYGNGSVAGFVGRHQQALITTYLAETSMLIPVGFGVTLYSGGDFWVKNSGSTAVTIGNKAYAKFADGSVSFAATSAATTASLTTSSIAAGTAISVTGSITGNVLTVTAVSTGTLVPGAILTGTNVASGTQIVSQLTSTAAGGALGGTGTYGLNIGEQAVASETISGTYGVLTVGGGGNPTIGSVLSGSGVTANTTVWNQLTNTTWVVDKSQTAGSTTITATLNVETKWVAMSAGAAGELIKISDHLLG